MDHLYFIKPLQRKIFWLVVAMSLTLGYVPAQVSAADDQSMDADDQSTTSESTDADQSMDADDQSTTSEPVDSLVIQPSTEDGGELGESTIVGSQSPSRIIVEEVIVTSTKRATSLQTTPVAVSAFTQDDLDREKTLDITNIADLVPNLQIGKSPSDSGVAIAIRGISSNNYTELGDPTVGIHVDGVFTPRPQAAHALLHDSERIEINRGPQGTLFGRNSTAGSINIITARPSFDAYKGNFELDAGSWNHYTAKGWVNLPFDDGFAMRFSFLYDISDGHLNQLPDNYDFAWDANNDGDFEDEFDLAPDGIPNNDQRRARNISGKDQYGGTDRYAVRLNSRLATSDTYSWLFTIDYFKDSSAGGVSLKDCEKAEGTFFECDHDQWDVRINTPGELDFRLLTYRTEFSIDVTDNFRMDIRAAASNQTRRQVYDSDGGAFADPDHPAYGLDVEEGNSAVSAALTKRYGEDNDVRHTIVGGPDGDNQYILDTIGFPLSTLEPWTDLSLITRASNYNSQVYEWQFSSIADPDNSFEWITGLFYMREDNAIQFDVDSAFIGPSKRLLAQSFVQPNRDVRSYAVFTQFDVPFSERFKMTFGLRWTRDEKADIGGQNYTTYNDVEAYTGNAGGFPVTDANGEPMTVDGKPIFIPRHAYDLVGIVPSADLQLYQSNDLAADHGTASPNFLQRVIDSVGGETLSRNTFSASWEQLTWKIGFDYAITEEVFMYGYVATGFKAGGFGDQVDVCGGKCKEAILNTFPYEPEENITYELGVKSTVFDTDHAGKMNLIATVFASNINNFQATVFGLITPANAILDDPGAVGPECDPAVNPTCDDVEVTNSVSNLLTYNVGESRSVGLELEFDWWNPWPNGHIFGWFTYLNAEILDLPASDGYYCLERAYLGLTPCPTSDPNIPDDVDTPNEDESRVINLAGNQLPWSPKYAFSLFIEHNFWLGDSGIKFNPYWSVHWSDEYFFTFNNYNDGPLHSGQPAYWSTNLSLRFIDDARKWRFEIYAHNLTNERIRFWQDNGPGYVRSSFASPRNYGMKLAWGF